ncbi:hypothetical protein VKT23_012924 [Stygiomarasmius scandens]|uniref:Argonaute-like protein n=1 Tax=Marasmiellus scandens TaxID=2682957 RepID=A0ABR1J7F5_9AGAR
MQPRGTRGGPTRGARGGGRGGRGGAPRGGPALVGRGPSAGPGSLQGGPSSVAAAHVQSVGVKRPGFGTAGQRTKAIVNALEMTARDDMMIYHYDATPEKTYPPRLNVQLIKTLQHDTAPQVFDPAGAYDGKKNLFMPHRLDLGPGDSKEFNVVLPANGHPSDRPPPVYRVKITFAAEINTTVLHRFTQGQQTQDEQVLTAIQALNVIIRADPIMNHPFNVRSFYPINGNRKAVGYGFELVRGYFQSVRPAIGKILLNVDITTGLFFRPGPLIEVALDFFSRRGGDPQLLTIRKGFTPKMRHSLQRFLSGVRVTVSPSNRVVTINKLTEGGADAYQFQLREGGERITVAEYFRRQQNRPLQYPAVLCILTPKGAAIPFEKCTVIPGQIARKQIPPELTKEMVDFSRKNPAERMDSIRQGVQMLAYGQSEYIRNFGLNVHANGGFPEVDARIIKPPKLRYGPGSKQPTLDPRKGQWNMLDKRFVKPMDITRWVVVIFESQNRMNPGRVQGMIKDYIEACRTVGVTVHEKDPIMRYANGQGNVTEQLKDAGKACVNKNRGAGGPDLLLVILPEHGGELYPAVKHFGDCTMGVATQCLNSVKCFRANDQYWKNVCLKTNPKLGGINVIPEPSSTPILSDPNNPTIIMGADVMHPAPGSSTPSFTAVVGNVDTGVAKYVATSNVQESRVEIIADLYDMAKSILLNYKQYREAEEKIASNRSAPKRLIFFRDGVSEGQFTQVRDQELDILKRVCADLKINVKITFIVVGKRHHYRFKPPEGGQADRSGNMPAGTVVDQGITHPVEFDFYLQSHAGLIGTSRSAHYNVLYDDNNFNVDPLQDLCYTLCHVYARATRSVSIPAPVYYADIVCARAKNHFDPTGNLSMSDTATQLSGSAAGDLQSYKDAYKQVAGPMARRMYFM